MTPSPLSRGALPRGCPIAILQRGFFAEAPRSATKKPDLVSIGHASVVIKTIP